MVDTEKLRKGLEYCPGIVHCSDYDMEKDCPYGDEDCIEKMHEDALAMLKEKETELCDRCGRKRLKSSKINDA